MKIEKNKENDEWDEAIESEIGGKKKKYQKFKSYVCQIKVWGLTS